MPDPTYALSSSVRQIRSQRPIARSLTFVHAGKFRDSLHGENVVHWMIFDKRSF
jgi:hypothetical protein